MERDAAGLVACDPPDAVSGDRRGRGPGTSVGTEGPMVGDSSPLQDDPRCCDGVRWSLGDMCADDACDGDTGFGRTGLPGPSTAVVAAIGFGMGDASAADAWSRSAACGEKPIEDWSSSAWAAAPRRRGLSSSFARPSSPERGVVVSSGIRCRGECPLTSASGAGRRPGASGDDTSSTADAHASRSSSVSDASWIMKDVFGSASLYARRSSASAVSTDSIRQNHIRYASANETLRLFPLTQYNTTGRPSLAFSLMNVNTAGRWSSRRVSALSASGRKHPLSFAPGGNGCPTRSFATHRKPPSARNRSASGFGPCCGDPALKGSRGDAALPAKPASGILYGAAPATTLRVPLLVRFGLAPLGTDSSPTPADDALRSAVATESSPSNSGADGTRRGIESFASGGGPIGVCEYADGSPGDWSAAPMPAGLPVPKPPDAASMALTVDCRRDGRLLCGSPSVAIAAGGMFAETPMLPAPL
mmetsp:Transcript_49541/g.152909  ORF Transcript_49541/g.152909 Transcript_49541/m.152909 type:complete len:475 (-) Transcript_49541:2501-3925(-)